MTKTTRNLTLFLTLIFLISTATAAYSLRIGRLQYEGGGDWYNDPSIIPNITEYFNEKIEKTFETTEAVTNLRDPSLAEYPFVFMTGHGNVSFSEYELVILRRYLEYGGFLFIDDDYGMDQSIRAIIGKLFPDNPPVRIYPDHPIYTSFFKYDYLPKIHEHDGKDPEMWGIILNGRLSLVYTYETNISDGWASPDVHKDPPEIRRKALEFGCNIIYYALTH